MQLHNVCVFRPTLAEVASLAWFIARTFVEGRIHWCVDRDSNPDAPKGSGF